MTGTTPTIDLNADLGEGMGDDDAMLALVTSANVACGGHAGDDATMARVCKAAAERGVAIGAHVAYADRDGFGRRDLDIAPTELTALVADQVAALAAHAVAAGGAVAYVKPHGALYNRIARDEAQAAAVVAGVVRASGAAGYPLALLGLPGSAALEQAARVGVPTATEAFVDRAYRPDGTLVPRSERGAVIDDPDLSVARAVAVATGLPVAASGGGTLHLRARSLCVHGDTPGAVGIATRVRDALAAAGVELRAFAGAP